MSELSTSATQFVEFIRDAEGLLSRRSSTLPVDEFKAFVEAAEPLVVADSRELLRAMSQVCKALAAWHVDHDMFNILGITGQENPYSNFLAWLFDEALHPPSVLRRQQALLSVIDDRFGSLSAPARAIIREDGMGKGEGTPDFVILLEDEGIVIEAKTGSNEHTAAPDTGGTELQTVAYPKAVQAKYGLAAEPCVCYLTYDRFPAANPDAKNRTWLEFAAAFALAVRPDELQSELRALIGTGLIHLARSCVSGEAFALMTELGLGHERDRKAQEIIGVLDHINEIQARMGAVL